MSKIVIDKDEIIDAIKDDLIREISEDFFEWMHGSGCDAVEENIFGKIRENILERLANDKEFLDGVKKELIKDTVKYYEPSDITDLIKEDVAKEVAVKILEGFNVGA